MFINTFNEKRLNAAMFDERQQRDWIYNLHPFMTAQIFVSLCQIQHWKFLMKPNSLLSFFIYSPTQWKIKMRF